MSFEPIDNVRGTEGTGVRVDQIQRLLRRVRKSLPQTFAEGSKGEAREHAADLCRQEAQHGGKGGGSKIRADGTSKEEQLAAGISTSTPNKYEQLAAPDVQRGAFTSHWRFLRERRRDRLRPAYTSKRDSCQPVLAGHRRQ
jgi:hypothetical protein